MRCAAALLFFRRVSLGHLRTQAGRSILTMLGVAAGVATVVAIADVSDSVVGAFRDMVRTISGRAALEVSTAAGRVPEDLVLQLRGVPGVRSTAGVVESSLPIAGAPGQSIYLVGIDFLDSELWHAQFPRDRIEIEDELAFVAQPDSVVLTRAFAQRSGLEEGARISVVTPLGPKILTVRGLLADVPAARLLDGAIAVMDLPAAMRLLDRGGMVERVLVDVDDGADPDVVRENLLRSAGSGSIVAPPDARGARTDQLLESLRALLLSASFSAVIVGGLIVFNAVAIALRERRRELALLHALGIPRRTLALTCIGEAVLLAAGGTIVGVMAGRVLASLLVHDVATAVSGIWGEVARSGSAVSSDWGTMLAIGLGFVVSVVATLFALRATFATTTVEALGPVEPAVDLRPSIAGRLAASGALLSVTWLVLAAPPGLEIPAILVLIESSQIVAIIAAGLIAPLAVLAAARALTWIADRRSALPLRLAVDGLRRAPVRGGATVMTIVGAMSITVALTVLVQSFESAWMNWLDQHFGADLYVGGGGRVRLLAGPAMPPEIGRTIAGLDGVAAVEPFRVLPIDLVGRPVFLQGISVRDRLEHGGMPMVQGTFAEAAPDLAAGRAVLISDNLAYRAGLARGDEIGLPTPRGVRHMRIAGTYVDFLASLDRGSVAVAYDHLADSWNDRTANLYRVWLRPDASASAVRLAIQSRLPSDAGYYVLASRAFLDGVRSTIESFFSSAWALQVAAALVGLIGIVNAQLASVLERRREIGALRTVGLRAKDLARGVLLECAVLGLLGGVLGAIVGAMLGAQAVRFTLRAVTGWSIPVVLPVGLMAAAAAVAAILSGVAGSLPARRVARLRPMIAGLD